MSPVTKIALRRLKNNRKQHIYIVVAVFVSMMIISLLVFFQLQITVVENPSYAEFPFTSFMNKLKMAMNMTIAFLVAITCITVRIHCSMRSEDHRQIVAVLTSVGATGAQKHRLILTDIALLYLPPIFLGVIGGIIPGIQAGKRFGGVSKTPPRLSIQCIGIAVLVTVIAVLLVWLSHVLPGISINRRSVIQSIRRQNRKASEERHGYRCSQAYRSQALLKRLARKSIDYYAKAYNRISLSFAISALYPTLAIFLFGCIGNANVVIDGNPYDGIDTSESVLSIIDGILVFLGVALILLTFIGFLQAVLISRAQIAARQISAHTYLALGMSRSDISKMFRLELRSVLTKAVIILLFSALAISFCYRMI